MNDDVERKSFASRAEFRAWLEGHHDQGTGIWIIFQKNSKAFSANDALEEAICYGWIDGLLKSIDSHSYQKYFSKRKDTGKWSEKNKKLYQMLLEKGRVTQHGSEVYRPVRVENRGKNNLLEHVGKLKEALSGFPEAAALFQSKSLSRQKQMAGFYCEARTEETRQRRIAKIIEALNSNDKGMLY